MATTLSLQTSHFSHPALATGLVTPPLTPSTPTKSYPVKPHAPPVVDYALLRSHHAYALKYVIAKLRWEQTNNDFIRGEDAWLKHIRIINKLEAELKDCQAAQKGLDQFPNCFAPIAFPKPHGPPSKEQFDEENRKAANKEKEFDAKLETQFPFIKQLFIGPLTKLQARNQRQLRDQLKEGDFEDLSVLLPSENMRLLVGGNQEKAAPAGIAAPGGAKKPYERVRMEKEKAKVAAMLENAPPKKVTPPAAKIGPLTKEEWIATLPVAGPKTREEVMLPQQREQRHVILTFLRKPWPEYDDEAAGLMEKLGRLAMKRLTQEARETKEAEKADKSNLEAKKEVKA